jgi:hypothetical protein
MCCDSHQLLSEDQKCVGLEVFTSASNPLDELNNYKSEVVTKDTSFKCYEDSKRKYFTTKDTEFNASIVEGSFCVHPSTVMGLNAVLFCHQSFQIRKCCPLGQLVNRTSIDKCVVDNKGEATQLQVTHLIESTVNYDDEEIRVQENASLQCDFDYNVYIPGYYIDHGFKVSNEFGLFVKKAAYAPIRHSKNYCIDNTVDVNGTGSVSLTRMTT